jgi:hypothetical protein
MYSLANEGINRNGNLPSPESDSVILQQIVAIGEICVIAAKSVNVSPLRDLDVSVHKIAVRSRGKSAGNGGRRHDE